MRMKIVLTAFLCACCFSEEAIGEGENGETTENIGNTSSESDGAASSEATTGATTRLPVSEESGLGSESSGSESDESTGEGPRFCAFSGAPCESDEECGIPGVCYAPGQSCLHWCASDEDCPETLYCFYSAELDNSHCAGCVGDDDKCAGASMCVDDVTCAVQPYAECVANNQPCTISDSCS